ERYGAPPASEPARAEDTYAAPQENTPRGYDAAFERFSQPSAREEDAYAAPRERYGAPPASEPARAEDTYAAPQENTPRGYDAAFERFSQPSAREEDAYAAPLGYYDVPSVPEEGAYAAPRGGVPVDYMQPPVQDEAGHADYVLQTPEQEEPRTGFVLRRGHRDPVVASQGDPAAGDVTRQFEAIAADAMETAQEPAYARQGEQQQEDDQPPDNQPSDARGPSWEGFRMLGQGNDGQEGEWSEQQPDMEDESDLNTPDDILRVRKLLRTKTILAGVRLGVLTLTAAGTIYLVLSMIATVLPVPATFSLQEAPGMFALALFALSLVSFAVCITSIGSGLLSLVKLKADGDSMTAVASLSTLLYTFAFVISPELFANPNAQMFCVVAVMGLWFGAVGKLMSAMRTTYNLSVAGSGERLYAVKLISGEGFAEELAPLMEDSHPKIAAQFPADFLKGLLRHSGAGAQEKGISGILSPICVGAAAVLAGASYFLYRDVLTCFTVFTAVVCVCAPFTMLLNENLPLLRAAKSLTAQGAMIAGGEAAEAISEASSVVVDAAQLFGEGGITLHGIRTFKGGRIDVSILAAASIMEKVNGTMADVFFQIIEGRTEILGDVDDIVYEADMGISAWVSGEHVLIGSRELMRHHGIELPSREYEQKYLQEGRDILYLASAGELSSMFVITYNATEQVCKRLRKLERARVTLLVRTTDPNITREMITNLFEIDYDLIQIMPAQLHGEYVQMTAHKPLEEAQAATMGGGALSLFDTLATALKVRAAGTVASVLQTLFIIAGYAFTTVITFFFGISLINPLLLLCYQLVAALTVISVLSLRRY
ncbi:MAG: hypothetical protein ACERKO_02370, partial [Acetanaerobacterium sp.]